MIDSSQISNTLINSKTKPMATITKRDLVIRISNETGLTQQEVFGVIQCFIEEVTSSLSSLSLIHISEPTRPY